MTERTLTCQTERDTEGLGERLGALLDGEAFVALYGGLGAGKTAFARGIGKSLDVPRVQSPTFTIICEHAGRVPFIHIDAYRLSGSDELYMTGYGDCFGHCAVIVLEWADLVEDALPAERIDVWIDGSGSDERTVYLRAAGCFEEVLKKL